MIEQEFDETYAFPDWAEVDIAKIKVILLEIKWRDWRDKYREEAKRAYHWGNVCANMELGIQRVKLANARLTEANNAMVAELQGKRPAIGDTPD